MEDQKYPLFPSLNKTGNEEAQKLLDEFKIKAKKILDGLLDEYLGTVYVDLCPEIESDSWTNYRNALMSGFKNYENRHVQNRYDFKAIRQSIFEQFRDQIIDDLNQDNLEKIKELEGTIKFMQAYQKNY